MIDPTAQAGKVAVRIDSFMICVSSTAIVINASFSNRELRLMIPDDLHTAISLIYLLTTANGTNWKEKLAVYIVNIKRFIASCKFLCQVFSISGTISPQIICQVNPFQDVTIRGPYSDTAFGI